MSKGLVRLALLLCMWFLALPAWATVTGTGTLSFKVGNGSTTTFTSSQGTFFASGNATSGYLTITFQGSGANLGDFEIFQIKAATGQSQVPGITVQNSLAPGVYDNTQNYAYAGPLQPGLSFGGCNNLPGRFIIREISWTNATTLASLAVDFQQNCSVASGIIKGSLRFNDSTTPIPYASPTADAGSPQLAQQGATVTLDGSLSDGGTGAITGYSWTQLSGTSVALSNATVVKPTFTAPTEPNQGGENLVFQLQVTSTTGTPNTSTVTVHVGAPGDPQTLLNVSGDPGAPVLNGTSLSYNALQAQFTATKVAAGTYFGSGFSFLVNAGSQNYWNMEFLAPKGASLQVGQTYDMAVEMSTSGTPPFLSVSENGSCSSGQTGRFVVEDLTTDGSGNLLTFAAEFETHCYGQQGTAVHGQFRYNSSFALDTPFVDAGPAQVTGQGQTVNLSAGDSTAGSGDIITSYQWTQTGGPTVTLSADNVANPSFTAPSVSAGGADLTFQLTITNSDNLTSTDTVTVHVAAPGDAQTYYYAASDVGDPIDNGKVLSITSDQASFTAGRVISNGNVTQVSVGMTVAGQGETTVTFAAPTGQTLQVGSYPYAGQSSGAGLAELEIYPGPDVGCNSTGDFTILDLQVSGGIVTSFAADFEEHCDGTAPALRGHVRYQSTVEGHNPFAVAGQPQRVAQGATVNLAATGSDPGALGITITGYQWAQLSGTSATLSDPMQPNPSFTAPAVPSGGSDLVFQLTVTNSLGLTATSSVTVHVMNPSDPPYVTELHLDSETGDPLGGGKSVTYDTSVADINVYAVNRNNNATNQLDSEVQTKIGGNPWFDWNLTFAAPSTQDLQPGKSYDPAQWNPEQSPTLPSMNVNTSEAEGCDVDTQNFAVLDLQMDPYGTVHSAAVDFLEHCTGASGSLHGAYRYNSDVPVTAPYAAAGPAQLVLQETTVQLTGDASYAGSPNDTLTSYQWTQLSGPSVTLSDPTLADPSFSAPDVTAGGADLVFQLTVTNSENLTGSDTVSVHVSNPADPVTVLRLISDAGDPALNGHNVQLNTLTATFVTDKATSGNHYTLSVGVNGGNQDNYTIDLVPPSGAPWALQEYTGAVNYQYSVTTAPQMNVDCDSAAGDFIIRDLTLAGDGTVLSLAADFVQHCNGAKAALHGWIRYNSTVPLDTPFANPGNPQAAVQGDTVTLDGSATYAGGDGATISSWQWTQIGGPAATLSDATAESPTFTAPAGSGDQTLTFQLTVTNSLGQSSSEDVTVLVQDPSVPHSGMYLQGAPDYDTGNVQLLRQQPLDGTFTAATPSTGAIKVTYTGVDGSNWYLTFVPPVGQLLQVGTYRGVTSAGTPGTAAEMQIGQDYWGGCDVTGQFTVRQVSYDGGGNVTALAVDFKQDCYAENGGAYPVLRGKLRFNSTVDLRTPLANGGYDLVAYSGFPLSLDGSASSTAFGTLTGYNWSQLPTGQPTLTLNNATTAQTSFTAPVVATGGNLQLQLTVNNSLGQSDQDTVNVQLVGLNDPKTTFYYQSDVDDPDGKGATELVMPMDASVETVSYYDTDFNLNPTGATAFDQIWEFSFEDPNFNHPLKGKVYTQGPDWLIATDGACEQTSGAFVVRDIEFDQLSRMTSFAADFVRHCKGATGDLRGAFRYNSTVPILVNKPAAAPGPDQLVQQAGAVVLDGSNSISGWSTLTSYRWKQVSGPAVQILGQNSAIAQFKLPGNLLTVAGTALKFSLTVTNALGLSDTETATITAKLPSGSGLSMWSDAGDPVGRGNAFGYSTYYGATVSAASQGDSVIAKASYKGSATWNLEFAAPKKQILKVGSYVGAVKFSAIGLAKPGLYVNTQPAGSTCRTVAGDFKVLDVQYQNGAIASLALDFDQTCNGAPGALHGKLRFHSVVP